MGEMKKMVALLEEDVYDRLSQGTYLQPQIITAGIYDNEEGFWFKFFIPLKEFPLDTQEAVGPYMDDLLDKPPHGGETEESI